MTPADLALKALAQKATPGPWSVHTEVDRGPHWIPVIGLVRGCVVDTPGHRHDSEDEADACVFVHFGVIHPNDSRKPPLHPDNAREMAIARHIAACSPERILSLLARLEQMEQALKRGIGAIEAYAMQGRGIPVNWDAINATQDEMRAALADDEGEK